MSKKIQLIIVEDEPAILRGLASVIPQIDSDYEVIAKSNNGADAVDIILNLKPDLVITDIQMPCMNGLDLIESVSSKVTDTKFIILTGYTEFKYTQRAIKLHVFDYLLKPIDVDALEKLLKRIKNDFINKNQKDIMYYLSVEFRKNTSSSDITPLCGNNVWLLFSFYGSVISRSYKNKMPGTIIAHDVHTDFCNKLAQKYNVQIYPIAGTYQNEKVFAILNDSCCDNDNTPIKEIANEIHNILCSKSIFVNSILSDKIPNGHNMALHVQNCYFHIATNLVFDKSRLMFYENKTDETSLTINPAIKDLLQLLKPAMTTEMIESLTKNIIDIWKSDCSTQFQIQNNLRYILSTAAHFTNSSRYIFSDSTELLALSSSYEDLYANLLEALQNILFDTNSISDKLPHTKALAEKIRNYLNLNYKHPIVYKDIAESFGYHEKYLSGVFKDTYGISPSKYVVELRLNAAKNIMENNPDILLKDVAEAVGYDDPLYFSRVFKNNEGLSPKAFQKNLRNSIK